VKHLTVAAAEAPIAYSNLIAIIESMWIIPTDDVRQSVSRKRVLTGPVVLRSRPSCWNIERYTKNKLDFIS